MITVDREAQLQCTEMLFRPGAVGDGSGAAGIADIAHASIAKCDADLRVDLYNAVVLAGGTSMFPGFADRLHAELAAKAGRGANLRVVPESQRKYAAWIGGSMFASLSTFAQIHISKQEYDNESKPGASIVHRKCF